MIHRQWLYVCVMISMTQNNLGKKHTLIDEKPILVAIEATCGYRILEIHFKQRSNIEINRQRTTKKALSRQTISQLVKYI